MTITIDRPAPRNPQPPAATATQCGSTCAEGGCSATCFLPAGHSGGRHRCQDHFLP